MVTCFILFMNKQIIELLQEYTGKKHIHLTDSGDLAIYAALWLAKNKGFNRLLIPDQGGWLSYKKYGKQLGFEVIELKTNLGIVSPQDLNKHSDCILLCTSLAGYYQQQSLHELAKITKQHNIFFILDVNDLSDETNKQSKVDILVSSFGKWKVVNNWHGGCIACDELCNINEIYTKIKPVDLNEDKLLINLRQAPIRLDFLRNETKEIIKQLRNKGIKIYNRDDNGIVVITEDKEEVKKYCKDHGLQFTLCPREIRINEQAISIEVKRL